MLLKKAMRYYRVWIYSCSLSLFVTTLIFTFAFIWIITDFHMALFPSVAIYQPDFVYCYFAIALQGGGLQAIGYFGAIRKNARLLNLYRQTLMFLLLGDLVIGGVWVFRYNQLVTNLRYYLTQRFKDYGMDIDFEVNVNQPKAVFVYNNYWDDIQRYHTCCGINGPYDFNQTKWFIKEHKLHLESNFLVPPSCCVYHFNETSGQFKEDACTESLHSNDLYSLGCYPHILNWLQGSFAMLSVLGFCVVTFLKFCFAFILHFEIKEMIQKIQIIKGHTTFNRLPLQELEAYLPCPLTQHDSTHTINVNQSISNNLKSQNLGKSERDLVLSSLLKPVNISGQVGQDAVKKKSSSNIIIGGSKVDLINSKENSSFV